MEKEKKTSQPKNKQENAGKLSRLFYWWINPLLSFGYKNDLYIEDIPEVGNETKAGVLRDTLGKEWKKELEKQHPSLLRALMVVFGKKVIIYGICGAIDECILRIVQPLLMSFIIEHFLDTNTTNNKEAYQYGIALILCSCMTTLLHHFYFSELIHLGMKLRVSCSAMIYKKCLGLSTSALRKATTGHVINLLSNDANLLDDGVRLTHYLIVGPLQLTIVTVLLWYKINYSAFVQMVIIFFLIPILFFVGRIFAKLRLKTAQQTDRRIKLVNDIIKAIKMIKMYAWESSFANLVHNIREVTDFV